MRPLTKIVLPSLLVTAFGALPVVAEEPKHSRVDDMAKSISSTSDKIQKSDTWLTSKLLTTIALNRHLSIFDIDAKVVQQKAYLSGVVDSDIDKDLAEEVAKSVNGITTVSNEILVQPIAHPTAKQQRQDKQSVAFFNKIEDLTTTASIKSKLLANDNIAGFAINVDTVKGHVKLEGTVTSAKQKALAEQIASNTTGVKEVENKLEVKM